MLQCATACMDMACMGCAIRVGRRHQSPMVDPTCFFLGHRLYVVPAVRTCKAQAGHGPLIHTCRRCAHIFGLGRSGCGHLRWRGDEPNSSRWAGKRRRRWLLREGLEESSRFRQIGVRGREGEGHLLHTRLLWRDLHQSRLGKIPARSMAMRLMWSESSVMVHITGRHAMEYDDQFPSSGGGRRYERFEVWENGNAWALGAT